MSGIKLELLCEADNCEAVCEVRPAFTVGQYLVIPCAACIDRLAEAKLVEMVRVLASSAAPASCGRCGKTPEQHPSGRVCGAGS